MNAEFVGNDDISDEQMEAFSLNTQRAIEISESSIMAQVTFNGKPVYIQHVDEQNETARIYPLDQPENEQFVPLNQLSENWD